MLLNFLSLKEKKVVEYVQKWRRKLFCTCGHIKKELKLDVSRFTILRTLGRHKYHWRQLPRKGMIKPEHMGLRKEFVDKHLSHRPAWWVENMHLVFDGVTLTKAPRKLSERQKHAAQSIKAMWMKKGEEMDPDLHTYNRYSLVQKKWCYSKYALMLHSNDSDMKSMGHSLASRSLYGEALTPKVGLH